MAVPLTCGDANRLGWAMQGRGEFSFLIAGQAEQDEIFKVEEADFASVIWGLLLTCVLTPFAFRYFLKPGRVADAQEPHLKEAWSGELPQPTELGNGTQGPGLA